MSADDDEDDDTPGGDEPPYAVYFKSPHPTRVGTPLKMTGEDIAQLTCYASYWVDTMALMRMNLGGPPALMRAAMIPINWRPGEPGWRRGQPRPDVTWFYVVRWDARPAEASFETFEEQVGALAKMHQAQSETTA